MPQSQRITQVQTEKQIQKLSPQQLLMVRLTELPLADLEERVKNELMDNVALEEGGDNDPDTEDNFPSDELDEDVGQADEDMGMEMPAYEDDAAYDYSSPDDMPEYIAVRHESDSVDIPIGDSKSFIDDLQEQMGDYDLNDHQRELMIYLIGSLNDNGLIDRPLADLADELEIYHDVSTSEEELETVLGILQQFDPPGIGARDLRECLLIQIDRLMERQADNPAKLSLLSEERRLVADFYPLFEKNNMAKLQNQMQISPEQLREVVDGIARLNPRPGLSLNESSSDRVQTIIPDFIIETDGDGGVTMWLNDGNVPRLHVNKEYLTQLQTYHDRGPRLSSAERAAFTYTKEKVDAAKMFIDTIRLRRNTLYVTMKAIIEWQKDFFRTLDDDDLRPMILKDIAEKTHLDISTISRVSKTKYAMIDGHVYPLKHFFDRKRTGGEGDDMDVRRIKNAIQELVVSEDKRQPLSDEQMVHLLNESGFPIKRRTVAKYRDQMGIPIAKLRKTFS